MIDPELELILVAKARRMGVPVNALKEVIAMRIVDGDTEEDPVAMVLSVSNRDIERLYDH
ncbi:hypothetical protein LRP52_34260 [Photobacterium sp. ZSDE20]|uniref:CopG family transcriptional regulator n=1 Tax=Photobacterium pectinilyticum TaxID=2906793 RepID=A0ABT1N7K3_9GAMM|nr:hypothetical protein [Photobacterium sp. ZSDE20]MCQ1060072.1 hypothetical protein [Photobacterium sp. ZSDE20]MDD1827252.1 hypothetical protein [Photobacterium sp. ZSDE20]